MPKPGSAGGSGAAASPSILTMSAPLVLSFWMRSAFSFVDTAYAATLGDAAVAAIGLAIPLEFIMVACWVGMSNGLTSNLSRAMGAHENRRVAQLLQTTWKMILRVLMPIFFGLAIAIWFGATRIGLDPEVGRLFAIYGAVTLAGSALTSFWSVVPDSLVKAHQDTRATMWAGIWSNVINLALNTLFLFVFGWGIFGIAFSTVIGRVGGLVYALRRAAAHEKRRLATMEKESPGIDSRPYRAILKLSIPSAAAFGLMALESGFINAVLAATREATAAIAAYSIYYRMTMFALMPIIASSVAALPYAARHFGRQDFAAIRRGFREATLAAAAYSILIVGPAAWWLSPLIAHGLTEEPITAQYALFALRLMPLACLASIPFFLCRPTFEGMQQGRPGLWMAIFRYVVLTGPFAYLGTRVAQGLGFPGFYGLVVALLAAGAVSSAVFQVWLLSALRQSGHGTAPRPAEA